MNWEAIGAIGEVVGAAGVIATLGYLAVQIRQNTVTMRASTLQTMTEWSVGLHDRLASDPELGRIFIAGVQGLDRLGPEEATRFHFLMMGFFRRLEHMERQCRLNRVAPEEWAGLVASIASVASQPGARQWWAENADRFGDPFSAWLERELGTTGTAR